MVVRFGCSAVTGRGMDQIRGSGRTKYRQDNWGWGKGMEPSVQRGRGEGGGAGRK